MKNLKMSKISLTNILKKTFKKDSPKKKTKKVIKKATKKIVKVKKVLPKKTVKKVTKKVSAKTKKIENKKVVNNVAETTEVKTDNLRISKSNEIKPEIKKDKKHCFCKIKDFNKINIGVIDLENYVIKFEKDKANGMVPVNKQSHLRPLATINQVNKCISILKSKPKIKRSMWSRRAQEYEAKISSGKIYELAEVVRDLNKGDDLMVDQSYSERQLFEKAYERILSEFQIVLGVSLEDTQKKLDKALKRNLGGTPQPVTATPKSATAELPTEEPIGDTDETEDPIEE